MKKSAFLRVSVFLLVLLLFCSLMACAPGGESGGEQGTKEKIILGDCGWESIRFNSHVYGQIIEKGYGYKYEVILGSTPVLLEGMIQGDVHALTEVWTDNYGASYADLVFGGDLLDLGPIFISDQEGLWVPTFVIEGDSERGIEPMAPNLKTVFDLEEYWELFKDPEDPSKGRVIGPPPVWFVSELQDVQLKTYGLDKWYNHFLPGSDVALATEMVSSYDEGRPIVAYHWAPDWVLGLGDWTLLEEPEFDEELWENGYGCKRKPQLITKAIAKDMPEWAPEIVDVLKKMKVSVEINNEALAYMQQNNAEAEEAALHFLKEYPDVWGEWVPADIADKIKTALE